MPDRRSPFIALVLSALVPGLGQLYNKETGKGLVIIGSCLGLGLLIYSQSGLNRITFALALLLVWISAITEAYKSAQAFGPLDVDGDRQRCRVAVYLNALFDELGPRATVTGMTRLQFYRSPSPKLD